VLRIRAVAVPVLVALMLGLTLLPLVGPETSHHAAAPPAPPTVPPIAPVAGRPTPLASGSPYIENTIDLRNQTLRSGNFIPGDGLYPYTPCFSASSNRIYVTNVATNYVTVLDAVNHALIGYLPVDTDGSVYCQVARDHVFIAGGDLHLIQVFNSTTDTLIANITIPGAGVLSFGYNPVLNWVYVSVVTRPWSVTAISNVNFSLLAVQYVRNAPAATLCDPVDDELYIGDDSDNVNVLNATTLAFITNITIALSPQGGAWDPLNDRVFLGAQAPYNTDDLAEVDPVNNTVVAFLTLNGWPNYTAVSPSGQWVYFSMFPGHNVTMINATNLSEQYTFPIGTSPDGITFDAATNEVVTANQATSNLTFLNATTGRVDFTVADGETPTGLAYDPRTDDLFVSDASNNEVLVWNTSSNAMAGSIPLPGGPTRAVYNAATSSVFVLQPGDGLVSEINESTLGVVHAWSVPLAAASFAVDAADGQLFVSDTSGFAIDVYSLSTGAPIASITQVEPTTLEYCPTTGWVYAVAGADDDGLIAIDPANDSFVAGGSVGLLSVGIACNPFNGNVYVTSQRTFSVSVLNGTTLANVAYYANQGGGSGVAYDTENAELLAASDNPPLVQTALIPGNLTIIGTVNDSIVATIPAAVDPDAAVYDPASNTFFVANEGSGTVSVVQPNTAPPRISSARLSPSVLYYPTGTNFTVTATTTSIYGVPCPPGVSFVWRVAPTTLAVESGANSAVETFQASATAGTGTVLVNATFDGATVTASAPLDVVGGTVVPLASAAVAPSSASLLVGAYQPFAAAALLQNGAPAPPAAVYTWSLAPISLGSLNSTSGTVVNFTAGSVGPGTLSLSVFYAGSYAYATAAINVIASVPDVVSRLVLSPSAPTVVEDTSVTLTALAYDPSGGNISSAATYHWQLIGTAVGSLALAPGFQQSYTAGNATGNDSLSVRATLNGATVWANTTIRVIAPAPHGTPGGGGSTSLFGPLPIWAWAVLVGVLVVVGAILLLRRRTPPPPSESIQTPDGDYVETSGVDVSAEPVDPPPV
jgi:DNA-binding beta-propeller fold protein YncE